MLRLAATAVTMSAFGLSAITACGARTQGRASDAEIDWASPVELARGGGEKGPWQQNRSRFDYVDDPTVALLPDGAAFVAWVDQRTTDVHAQVRDAAGLARSPAINVSRSGDTFSWLPRVVIAGNEVFLLWQEIIFSGGAHGGDIMFARSVDGGASFEPPVNVSRSVGGDGKGRLSAKVWHNGSLDLARSAQGGLVAVWTDYDGTLWLATSADAGATFSAPRAIAGEPARPARAPSVAVAGESVLLAWTVGEVASADVQLARSDDGGATFDAPQPVAVTPGYSDAPALAIDDGGRVHLAWAESTGAPGSMSEVRYVQASTVTAPFGSVRTFAASRGSASFPALAVHERDVAVSWELAPDPARPPTALAVVLSRDGGGTFSAPVRVPVAPGSDGQRNGGMQGKLTEKLAVRGGVLAVVNSSFAPGRESRAWLVRGVVR